MSNAADREVWLNFLDEVDEYLNTIESVLIGLAETGADPEKMDAALRAAHTIKGIGSMIECPSMSQLSHQLEDSLKIIRVRRSSVQVDAALELLLLKGLDSMRQISSRHRQALPITESWLKEHAYPSFAKLRDCLGEVQPSDELALLAEESDDDTAVIMFGTEVEELLNRLSSVIEKPGSPCLREELEMMVEELHDLGKMLQLDAFTSLCDSINQQLTIASADQIEPLAHEALALWQRSQALVMVGQLEKLPTQLETNVPPADILDVSPLVVDEPLEFIDSEPLLATADADIEDAEIEISAFEVLDLQNHTEVVPGLITDQPEGIETEEILETAEAVLAPDEVFEATHRPIDVSESDFLDQISSTESEEAISLNSSNVGNPDEPEAVDNHVSNTTDAVLDSAANILDDINLAGIEAAIENFDPAEFQLAEPTVVPEPAPAPPTTPKGTVKAQTDFSSTFQAPTVEESEEFVEIFVEPVEAPVNKTQDLQENTVRVPIKLLTQLNDLFGELIIQRNTMNSRLDQMEDLMNLFSQRMGSLEGTNAELQMFCNQLSVATSSPRTRSSNGATNKPSLRSQ